MYTLYEKEWHGIGVREVSKGRYISGGQQDKFSLFYTRFFEVYSSYSDLSYEWRAGKDCVFDKLAKLVKPGMRVLSVGCGIGYIEFRFREQFGDTIELHIHEISEVPLKWIKSVVSKDSIHIGQIEDVSSGKRKFDMVYMVAVEYAMNDGQLQSLLLAIRRLLHPNARLVVVSVAAKQGVKYYFGALKSVIKKLICTVSPVAPWEEWGWVRRPTEIASIMKSAGFAVGSWSYLPCNAKPVWIAGTPEQTLGADPSPLCQDRSRLRDV